MLYTEGSSVEIQTTTHWHLLAAVWPPVLSPSSILLPPLSHCTFIPTRKSLAHILTIFFSFFPPPFLKLHEYHHHHHWLDSPWWALAFLRSLAHSSLLRAIFFQFLIPNILISWLHEYDIVKLEIALSQGVSVVCDEA